MRTAAAALLGVLMALTAASAARGYDPSQSYTYRILDNPRTGDAFGFRAAIQQYAQGRSDRVFNSLASLLGGDAPKINFVPDGSPLLSSDSHLSANIADNPGAPRGTINLDAYATEGLVNDSAATHSGAVNQLPHEMAHTRQLPVVLADTPMAEGGAQAFADLVAQTAAQRARIPYTPGDFDGSYADFVKQAQGKGLSWLLAGQFGKPGAPSWP